MQPQVIAPPRHLQISNSHVRRSFAISRRICVRAIPKLPLEMRGRGAPQGATGNRVAIRNEADHATPCGAPQRRFLAGERAFGGLGRRPSGTPTEQRLSPPLAHPASASQWRGFVVSPDADPRPPEPLLARQGRRRRIPVHCTNASRSAPHDRNGMDYNLNRNYVALIYLT